MSGQAVSFQTMPFQIPEEHPCYEAHFPDAAVVPGALLLFWVEEKLNNIGYSLEEVSSLKFLTPALPGQSCSLHLQLKEGLDVPAQHPVTLAVQCFCNDSLIFKGVLKVGNLVAQ